MSLLTVLLLFLYFVGYTRLALVIMAAVGVGYGTKLIMSILFQGLVLRGLNKEKE